MRTTEVEVKCCVCGRVKHGCEWMQDEAGMALYSHGYCPVCYQRALAAVESFVSSEQRKRTAVPPMKQT
ncbi:MAG: hypothetical protein HN742_07600 [Lentisphaerae bacterium]|jgi:hypothetical protein|nr:hypothetical protein [Lentisphaerota bacterium]MBT4823421.1 hypothetical protein [Lentisphaerota bacterium]MBT5606168.1 hypothetical protein [Lentisphaerota bacterium]MBT7057886.1 hypothetical protein [Lentisphaerota bacterium]MBT7841720.1 hypothetical protein [Lentisphaerota bacterium]